MILEQRLVPATLAHSRPAELRRRRQRSSGTHQRAPCKDERVERRTVEQLAGVDDPAWAAIARLIDQAGTARVLDADPERARRV